MRCYIFFYVCGDNMSNKNKMKSLNLSGSQAEIVIKSLNERLYEFDEELDVLESRIVELKMKKNQLIGLLTELGGSTASEGAPKKRGRKPGSGKKAAIKTAVAKVAKKVANVSKKKAVKSVAVKATATKSPKAVAAPKKGKKVTGKKAVDTKVATIAPTAAPTKKTAVKKAETKKATGKKAGRKEGENTLASKIIGVITEAKKGLSTREIVDAIKSKYGSSEQDERKVIQAISSTLISLTKRGKLKRETTADKQILNALA